MGYGRGMYAASGRVNMSHLWMTKEQILAQTEASRFIRAQKCQGTYKAKKKRRDAINKQLAKDLHLPWGSHTWTDGDLEELDLEKRVFKLNKAIVAKLYDGQRSPLNASLPYTEKVGLFGSIVRESNWEWEYSEIQSGIMAGNTYCALTVCGDLLFEGNGCYAIYLFINDGLKNIEDLPAIEGFKYVREKSGYAYVLKLQIVNEIMELTDDKKPDYIALLISRVTQQFGNILKARGLHISPVRSNRDGKIFTEPADVLKFYYGHDVPWVISEFRKIQMTDEEIVKRLKSEYAYYKYVDYHFRPQDFHYEW